MTLFALILGWHGVRTTPMFNWDLLGYVGVTLEYRGEAPEEAHQKTYAAVRAKAPPDKFQLLVSQSDFRRIAATNYQSFQQLLPFYSTKPLYPALMLLLNRIGVNVVDAAIAIPRASYLLMGILLFVWIGIYCPPIPALAFAAAITSLPFVRDLAGLATPDALSTLLLVSASFALLEQKARSVWIVLFVASVVARPDNLMFVAILAALNLWGSRGDRAVWFVLMSASIIVYYVETTLSGNYGWRLLIYHSFVQLLSFPAQATIDLSLADYLRILRSETRSMARTDNVTMLFFFLNLVAIKSCLRADSEGSRRFGFISIALLLYPVVHWVIIPTEQQRYCAGTFLLVLVLLIIVPRQPTPTAAR